MGVGLQWVFRVSLAILLHAGGGLSFRPTARPKHRKFQISKTRLSQSPKFPESEFSIESALSDATNQFEYAVRKATGNPSYKFGDITKSAVEGTVKAVTRNETYQFDMEDTVKTLEADMTRQFEEQVRSVTGNTDYKFGDITNGFLSSTDQLLTSWRDESFNEFTRGIWRDKLTPQQRRDGTVAFLQLLSVGALSYGFVANCNLGLMVTLAWFLTCRAGGMSPIADGQWATFTLHYNTLQMATEAPFLPVRLGLALFLAPHYRNLVLRIQTRLPFRKSKPVLNRVLAIFFAWAFVNGLAVGCTALAAVGIIGSTMRVPALPCP